MVVLDAHTHIYPCHLSQLSSTFFKKVFGRFTVFNPSHFIIVLAETARTVRFEEIADHFNARLHDSPIQHFSVAIESFKATFVNAQQVTDVFGCEFTVINDKVYLTYNPTKYMFGIRRKIYELYGKDKMIISTPLDPSPKYLSGSDVLPYPTDIYNILACGSFWRRFDLSDFLAQSFPSVDNFVGSFNYFRSRFFRLVASQRFFTRLAGKVD